MGLNTIILNYLFYLVLLVYNLDKHSFELELIGLLNLFVFPPFPLEAY